MNKLISISGSQGTGKSSILTTLKELGYNVIERKTSRSMLKDLNITLSDVYANHDTLMKFQDALLIRKIEDEEKLNDGILFTERSFADLFIYPLVVLGHNNKYSQWLNEYYSKCKNAQKRYHKVVYLRKGFSVEDDGVRSTNEHFGQLVDETLYKYLKLMTPYDSIVDISSIEHNERIRIIKSCLS